MNSLSIVIIIIAIFGFLSSDKIKRNKRSRKFFCLITVIVLSLLSAIRADDVGTDTIGYIEEFEVVSRQSYISLFRNYPSCFGYYMCCKFLNNHGLDVRFWFFLVALLFNSAVFYFIFVYSKNPVLSFALYIGSGIFAFSLAGMKQIVAMSFCIFSYCILQKNKRIILSILFVLLGSVFHQSALFFLLILPFVRLNISKKWNVVFFSLLVVMIVGGSTFLRNFIGFLAEQGNKFGNYSDDVSELNFTQFYIYSLLVLTCFVFYRTLEREKIGGMVYAEIIALAFFFLTTIVSSMFRMAYYLVFFLFALFPNVVSGIKDRPTSQLICMTSGIVFILYFALFSRIDYSFFFHL